MVGNMSQQNNIYKKFILDTNAVIYLLSNKIKLLEIIDTTNFHIIIPGIVYMELLSKSINATELETIQEILNDFEVAEAGLHEYLVGANLRRKYKSLKSADALVAATAKTKQGTLITGDKLLLNIKEVNSISI